MWIQQLPFLMLISFVTAVLILKFKHPILQALLTIKKLLSESFYWHYGLFIYSLILIFYAVRFPLSFDEALTFNSYTSKPIKELLFTYSQPNNHVFHSLLTWISWKLFHWIPGPLPVRLPSIIASILSFQLIQHYFIKRSPFYTGLLVVVLICVSNYFQFSFQARGYSIHSLMAILSILLLQHQASSFKTRYTGFMMLTAIGLYTNPTYLFIAVSLGLYFFVEYLTEFKKHLAFILFISLTFLLITYLTYAPIIYHEGIKALTNNQFVLLASRPITWHNFINFTLQLKEYLFLPNIFSLILPLLFIVLVLKNKKYSVLMLIISPVVMMLISNKLPTYCRIFLPFSLSIIAITCQLLQSNFPINFRKSWQSILASCIGCLLIIWGFYHFEHDHPKDDFNTAFHLRRINQYVSGAKSVYTYNVYWHLNTGIKAQKIYGKTKWQSLKVAPIALISSEYLISSTQYPQFNCVDTFKLHNGVAYLYQGAN